MDCIISEVIEPKEMMKFEAKYKKEESLGTVDNITAFEYAWCLVRSKYKNDWKKGVDILEKLYQTGDRHAKRDYVFYIAIAHYKLKNYDEAMKFCDAILHVEPRNHQAQELMTLIKETERKRAMTGLAVVGGASLVVGVGVAAIGAIVAAAVASRK